MSAQDLEKILAEVRRLSLEDRLRLMTYVAESLSAPGCAGSQGPLVYGKYRNSAGGYMSSEEDFKSAQWHPTEKDLNGL
jgi:hypothetical protein